MPLKRFFAFFSKNNSIYLTINAKKMHNVVISQTLRATFVRFQWRDPSGSELAGARGHPSTL